MFWFKFLFNQSRWMWTLASPSLDVCLYWCRQENARGDCREAVDFTWHLCKEESGGWMTGGGMYIPLWPWGITTVWLTVALILSTVTGKRSVPHWGGCTLAGLLFTATVSGLSKQLQILSNLLAVLISYILLSFRLICFPGCASS